MNRRPRVGSARSNATERPNPRAPLDPELYGVGVSHASSHEVQSAPTVSEMIERSRLPRSAWYEPEKAPKPVADPVKVAQVTARMRHVRENDNGSRAAISAITGWSQSAITRFETDRVKVDELDEVTAWLDERGVPTFDVTPTNGKVDADG